ncbi:MAG: hypothetical protein PWQ20_1277 [Thermotogaceae bacterium]|jgi:hypothetical protein|nr:hypothetical protein [Thermotogaceae bacterium]MDN5338207.1 hypothetical protein [Thermotogaceae bacterium]
MATLISLTKGAESMKDKSPKNFLDKKGIKRFYYITSLGNIPSILKLGILSRNAATKAKIGFTDISDLDVQERRKQYHNYVPLFFNPKNRMLFRVQNEAKNEIAILEISNSVIEKPGSLVSDINVAKDNHTVYEAHNVEWHGVLNFKLLNKRDIYLGGLSKFEKDQLQAEVLIKEKVEPKYVKGIVLIDSKYKKAIPKDYQGLIKIDKNLFFDIHSTSGRKGVMGKKRCPKCGEIHYDDETECDCGWVFYKKECPRCGTLIDDYRLFCPFCDWKFRL